ASAAWSTHPVGVRCCSMVPGMCSTRFNTRSGATSVPALLDELAPGRALKRGEDLPGTVEQPRTPTGCVLQAAEAAVSVSWFAETGNDVALGEMHVVVWHGTVQRRGAPPSRKGAQIVSELVLRPIEPPAGDNVWEATDGTRYDTAAL